MIRYYNMAGERISLEEWARLFEDTSSRVLARTDLPGGAWVSTVLLGLDHNFSETGPPIIFESMVFGPEDMTDLDCQRYATKEQAQAGHDELVTRWTGWTPGDDPPEDAAASFLTQFIGALEVAVGERPYRYSDSRADEMVVMYPKEIAERMEGDVQLRRGPADGPADEGRGRQDPPGDPAGPEGSARSGGTEVQQPVPGDGDRDPG